MTLLYIEREKKITRFYYYYYSGKRPKIIHNAFTTMGNTSVLKLSFLPLHSTFVFRFFFFLRANFSPLVFSLFFFIPNGLKNRNATVCIHLARSIIRAHQYDSCTRYNIIVSAGLYTAPTRTTRLS